MQVLHCENVSVSVSLGTTTNHYWDASRQGGARPVGDRVRGVICVDCLGPVPMHPGSPAHRAHIGRVASHDGRAAQEDLSVMLMPSARMRAKKPACTAMGMVLSQTTSGAEAWHSSRTQRLVV
jgi:hypothetical protein